MKMKSVLVVLASCLAAAGSSRVARAQTDAIAPQVTVDTPRGGGTYAQAQLAGALISGRARDNASGSGISIVAIVLSREAGGLTRFYDGRGFNLASGKYLLATLGGSGELKVWSLRLPTVAQGLAPGVYRVRALARDRSGNSGYSALASFAVRGAAPPGDRTPPSVSIDTPDNGGVYSATQTHFGALGSARDNAGGSGIVTVHIIAYRYADAQGPAGYFNGTSFSSPTPIENRALTPATTSDRPTQWLFDKPAVFTPGRILVRAIARDRAGNASSASITFTRR